MRIFLSTVALFLSLSLTAFAQSQGTSMRAINGIGFGTTTIGGNLIATNNSGSNYFAPTLNVRSSVVSHGARASKGLIIGDSTIAAYLSQNAVQTYLLTASDTLLGTTIADQSFPGSTIVQQQTAWTADAAKATYDWITVEIGLNDLENTNEATSVVLGRYQTLINTINAGKKATAVVIVATMTPCKQALINDLGATDGAIAYQKWLDVNAGIMGGGATPITGVNFRVSNHTTVMNDGDGNLGEVYEVAGIPDGVHENNEGRKVIASVWRQILNEIGYLSNEPPGFIKTLNVPDATFAPGAVIFADAAGALSDSLYVNGPELFWDNNPLNFRLGIGTTNPLTKLHVKGGGNGGVATLDNSAGVYSWMVFRTAGVASGYLGWNFNDTGSGVGTSMHLQSAGKLHLWDSTGTGIAISGASVGIGTVTPASKLDVVGTALANAFALRTNSFPVSPNFATGIQLFSTNAAFQFLACASVDTTKTQYQWTEIFVENSSGSPIIATPPDNVTGVCQPWYITNRSKFKVEVYGGDKFTNMYHVALR